MKLDKYLELKGLTQTQFAEISGVKQTLISRHILGKGLPSAKNMSKIIQATLGAVTLEDFIPTSHIDQVGGVVSEKVSREG